MKLNENNNNNNETKICHWMLYLTPMAFFNWYVCDSLSLMDINDC